MHSKFLYEKYDFAVENHFLNFRENIPGYITKNLRYPLRPYQEEAVGRYLHHHSREAGNKEQILFNMATGSGKTLLMAAIILEKYKQGERNFTLLIMTIFLQKREVTLWTLVMKNIYLQIKS